MDFTKFTKKELTNMLERHRSELTQMVLMSGVEAKAEIITQIEKALKEKEKDGKTNSE